jgi:hypothetical protein
VAILPLQELGGPQGTVHIVVFDRDDDGKDDLVGTFTCLLSGLANRGRVPMRVAGKESKKTPELIVADSRIVEIPAPGLICRSAGRGIELTISGLKLDKKDSGVGAKSDPCIPTMIFLRAPVFRPCCSLTILFSDLVLVILKGQTIIYRSEVVPKTLDPDWSPFAINLQNEVSLNDSITVECWDHDSDGGRDLIGRFDTTVSRFACPGYKWPLIGKSTKDGSNAGCILVKRAVPLPTPPLALTLPAPAYQFKLSARRACSAQNILVHPPRLCLCSRGSTFRYCQGESHEEERSFFHRYQRIRDLVSL